MKCLILHIGSPKTATTLSQGFFQENAQIFSRDYNIKVITPRDLRGSCLISYFFSELIGDNEYCENSKEVIEARCYLEKLFDVSEDVVFLSEETFSHELMPRKRTGGGFSSIKKTIHLIKKYFGKYLDYIKIVFTIREQASFLQSCYLHKVYRSGLDISFCEYLLNHVDPGDLSWYSLVKMIEKEFLSCKILPFELLFFGEKNFFRKISQSFLDVDISENININYKVPSIYKNESISNKAYNLMMKCNSMIPNLNKREQLCDAIIKNFPVQEFGKPVLFNDDWVNIFNRLYFDSNRAVLCEYSDLSEEELKKVLTVYKNGV